ncbi:MAG: hypothetical protein ACE15C_14385 [Phycisphaerae bacterium]
MKTARTTFLILGGILTGLGILGLLGAVVSVVVGVSAYGEGSHDEAGAAKLLCILSLILGVPMFGLGLVFLIPGVIMHVIIRRRANRPAQ